MVLVMGPFVTELDVRDVLGRGHEKAYDKQRQCHAVHERVTIAQELETWPTRETSGDLIDRTTTRDHADEHSRRPSGDSRDKPHRGGLKLNCRSFQPRDDYRELWKLSVIVLGGIAGPSIRFRLKGNHRSRAWNGQADIPVKIYVFRGQANLGLPGEKRAPSVCQVHRLGLRPRRGTPRRAQGAPPANDLALLKDLVGYEDRPSPKASPTASRDATCGYLNLFAGKKAGHDRGLSFNRARKTSPSGPVVDLKADLSQKTLADSDPVVANVLSTLGIDDGFLETDPAEWHDDPVRRRRPTSQRPSGY
ncbi:hypothetical protein GWK47_015537 [Chionoecetes opilio]|uniref:Uncharacterized protein n=1 Tax=Chionoecetes opilio TaxID=41210 RepID=A0A8J5BZR5_CHIOP|nr:hypothetical protein GWK47_015537 [Chionoecetes opilio]